MLCNHIYLCTQTWALQKKPGALQNLDPHQLTFVGYFRQFLAPHNFSSHFVKFHFKNINLFHKKKLKNRQNPPQKYSADQDSEAHQGFFVEQMVAT